MLLLLLLVIPVVEIYVIIQVGHAVGALVTIALLILGSVIGAGLVKREGLGVLRHIDAQLRDHKLPGKDLADGFLILLAGLLILIPGFVTDAFGFLLLLSPVRAGVRRVLFGRFQKRMGLGWMSGAARIGGNGPVWVDSRVIDVERPTDTTGSVTGDQVPPDAAGGEGPAELPPGRY